MKMYFENKIITWFDSFDVFDEIGRRLFRVKANSQGKKRLKVYDLGLRGKSVATIKKCDDNYPGVEIKHGSSFVSVVNKFLSNVYRLFDLGFLGWCARGDFEHGNFSLFDANNRTIASVYAERSFNSAMRCIDALPEFYLHSLTFALAIDVLVSDPSPNRSDLPDPANTNRTDSSERLALTG